MPTIFSSGPTHTLVPVVREGRLGAGAQRRQAIDVVIGKPYRVASLVDTRHHATRHVMLIQRNAAIGVRLHHLAAKVIVAPFGRHAIGIGDLSDMLQDVMAQADVGGIGATIGTVRQYAVRGPAGDVVVVRLDIDLQRLTAPVVARGGGLHQCAVGHAHAHRAQWLVAFDHFADQVGVHLS